ncbi:MAG: hypothetical protein SF066_14705 [Thermoanaerobaculia bacterium]|jgi:hypothetical protein|nr:hypothetical protein [Thermoanaerobaculia bacterium]
MKTSVLRSEIRDLQSLLQGLPTNLQSGPAFASYRLRLEKLQSELELLSLRQRFNWVRVGWLAAILASLATVFFERPAGQPQAFAAIEHWLQLVSLILFGLLTPILIPKGVNRKADENPTRP